MLICQPSPRQLPRTCFLLLLLLPALLRPVSLAAAEAMDIPRIAAPSEISVSPLAQAAMQRDMALVQSLLIGDETPDVNATGPFGTPALHWVVRYGDPDTAAWLLAAGADVNLANEYGARPLQIAIENGHIDLVRWLLEAGADPEGRNQAGEPHLFLAASMGDIASIDLLLAFGADVDTPDTQYDQTALMVAVREGQPTATSRLLAAGANINKQGRLTETMPGLDQLRVMPAEIPGTLTGGVGITRGGFPDKGARQPLAGAKTPLLYATRLGDLALTRTLVEAGADLEQADANGITPLINAIINTSIETIRPGQAEHLQVARYLIEAGARVDVEDWYGQTPLWTAIDVRNLIYRNVAATENHVDRQLALALIQDILAAGADPNARVREYPPARHFILGIGSVEWVDMTGQTPFLRAAQSGDVTVMTLLLEYGADPNISTYGGSTPLMVAAGINWAQGQTYDEGPEALLEAVRLTHQLGNDINAVNSMGLQAIHGAANRGSNDIIEYLAAHGAELDRPDNEGRTPVRWAEGEYLPSRPLVYRTETVELLQRLQAEGTAGR